MWEQLSSTCHSSPPFGAVTQHGIQSDKQYPHAGNERDFRALASLAQSLVAGFEVSLIADHNPARHVQRMSYAASSSVNLPFSVVISTVVVIRRDSRQGRNFPAIKLTELRQVNQQTGSSHHANAFHRHKSVGFFRVELKHAVSDVFFKCLNLRF
ncbi:hypothetical protein PSGE105469_08540 [Pseudomonas gessardii]